MKPFCDDCRHFNCSQGYAGCGKGVDDLKFVAPRDIGCAHRGEFGFRRAGKGRCPLFEESEKPISAPSDPGDRCIRCGHTRNHPFHSVGQRTHKFDDGRVGHETRST